MKESMWGYLILVLAIIVIVILLLVQRMTTTTEEDFYLGREIMEASMLDAVDYGTFRASGRVVMSQEKFVEVFIRRFAENVTNNKDYQLDFYDIYEEPPKATVRIRTVSGEATLKSGSFNIKLDTYMHGILETVYGIDFNSNVSPSQTGSGSGTAGTGALPPFGDSEEHKPDPVEEVKKAPPLSCNYQTQSSNSNVKFANGADLYNYGCGYTSLSMVANAFGKNISPTKVSQMIWNGDSNHSSSKLPGQNLEKCGSDANPQKCGRVTTGTLLNNDFLGSSLGLESTPLFNYNGNGNRNDNGYSYDQVEAALNRGEVVILRIPNHYITISGSPDNLQLCNPWKGEQEDKIKSLKDLFNSSAIKNWHGKCNNTDVGECGIWFGASYKLK